MKFWKMNGAGNDFIILNNLEEHLPPEELLGQMEELLEHCREMGFRHKNLLTFLTVMPLAVSPEIKCTDMGLLDVAHKKFLPLVEGIEEDG